MRSLITPVFYLPGSQVGKCWLADWIQAINPTARDLRILDRGSAAEGVLRQSLLCTCLPRFLQREAPGLHTLSPKREKSVLCLSEPPGDVIKTGSGETSKGRELRILNVFISKEIGGRRSDKY